MYKTECALLTPCIDNNHKVNDKVLSLVKPVEQGVSYVKGLGKARNNLVKNSKSPYLLFVDCGVTFGKELLEQYIKPAVYSGGVVLYQGENGVLCTKVFGLPRWVFLKLGGFDESFHIGEDLEFGFRLFRFMKENGVWGVSFLKTLQVVPGDMINHKAHEERGGYFISLKVRVRCCLRYGQWWLLKPLRKKDVFGVFAVPFLFMFYMFNNKRVDIKI